MISLYAGQNIFYSLNREIYLLDYSCIAPGRINPTLLYSLILQLLFYMIVARLPSYGIKSYVYAIE